MFSGQNRTLTQHPQTNKYFAVDTFLGWRLRYRLSVFGCRSRGCFAFHVIRIKNVNYLLIENLGRPPTPLGALCLINRITASSSQNKLHAQILSLPLQQYCCTLDCFIGIVKQFDLSNLSIIPIGYLENIRETRNAIEQLTEWQLKFWVTDCKNKTNLNFRQPDEISIELSFTGRSLKKNQNRDNPG